MLCLLLLKNRECNNKVIQLEKRTFLKTILFIVYIVKKFTIILDFLNKFYSFWLISGVFSFLSKSYVLFWEARNKMNYI